ncbi:amino acid ABC transporter permease [Catellatospora tritici]|uniref:amino acid ABC transporter permease n=1 Tax=Catellatospora tritici TaxID=2851566 RepID=UPI001C2DEC42|nr:amino acid ABC transporter permease [Catellatospora tritici]MBV1855584.1 amino acid ABC transporter permease [Catellatospora tritici]
MAKRTAAAPDATADLDTAPAAHPLGGTDPDDVSGLPVARNLRPGRWAAVAVVLVLLAMAGHMLVTNPAWDWPIVGQYLFSETVVEAVWLTLRLTALGLVLGFALGTVLALMRMSGNPLLSGAAWGYVWLFRSVPLILQLLFWYNLALLYKHISFGVPFGPSFFEIGTMDLIGPMTAATLGLALHQAAYASEIVRSGLISVDQGQLEAAASLGLPRFHQLRRIVLPQAMRAIIPNAGNELIGLVKGTSVVYIMALPELFYQVQVIYNRNGRVIALLLVAAVWYLILTTILSIVQHYIERFYARGALRNPPPTLRSRLRATLAGSATGARTALPGGSR